MLLALATSNATYCCPATAGSTSRNDTMHNCCIMSRSAGEAGKDFNRQRPPNLNPTMQQSITLQTRPTSPPSKQTGNIRAGLLARNIANWIAATRRRFAHVESTARSHGGPNRSGMETQNWELASSALEQMLTTEMISRAWRCQLCKTTDLHSQSPSIHIGLGLHN